MKLVRAFALALFLLPSVWVVGSQAMGSRHVERAEKRSDPTESRRFDPTGWSPGVPGPRSRGQNGRFSDDSVAESARLCYTVSDW